MDTIGETTHLAGQSGQPLEAFVPLAEAVASQVQSSHGFEATISHNRGDQPQHRRHQLDFPQSLGGHAAIDQVGNILAEQSAVLTRLIAEMRGEEAGRLACEVTWLF